MERTIKITEFTINVCRSGVAYGHKVVTVQLSLAVLGVYAIIVVVYHFLVIVVIGKTATSWDSIGLLICLALNTQWPGHMEKTSVRVDLFVTYATPVNILIKAENSVETVLCND